ILAECARLAQDIQTRDSRVLGDIARMSVELAVAIAEPLVGAAITADQQRLDRIVLGVLDRMPPARAILVRGHSDDLALLEKQIPGHADMERFRGMLTFRSEPACSRGQWKVEAEEWF